MLLDKKAMDQLCKGKGKIFKEHFEEQARRAKEFGATQIDSVLEFSDGDAEGEYVPVIILRVKEPKAE